MKASPPTPLSERARRSSQEADKHRLMEMYREDLQKQRGKEGRLSVHAPRRYSNEPPAPPMFRTNLKEQGKRKITTVDNFIVVGYSNVFECQLSMMPNKTVRLD